MSLDRSRLVSAVAGFAGAVVIALVGPLYGGLVLICGTPLIFLTLSRALIGATTDPAWPWLLTAFGIGWFVLVPVAPFVQHPNPLSTDEWELVVAIGLVPILGGSALVGLSRIRRRSA
jgi:hypothetical protein